jgi:hypothetical protein
VGGRGARAKRGPGGLPPQALGLLLQNVSFLKIQCAGIIIEIIIPCGIIWREQSYTNFVLKYIGLNR